MTVVVGCVRRKGLTLAAFADITDAPIITPIRADRIEFAGTLTDEQVRAVWARMESTDDADQAKRAVLRADRDALAEGDPLRRLYDYVLGDG